MAAEAAGGGPDRVDFFISYTGADEAWATWVGEVLEADARSVRLQAWDSPAGENFVVWISTQIETADHTIAICSPSYFDSHWCTQEWTAALADQAIIPLRVTECTLPKVLHTISYRDIFGVDETVARRRLLEAIDPARVVRASNGFPGRPTPSPGAAFPGRLPDTFNVPSRSRHFTGRQQLLDRVRTELVEGGPVAVTALHGLGGIGKTQLAIEYAHRHAASYELVWWIDAEQTALVAEQVAALAPHLGLAATGRQVTKDAADVLSSLRRRDGWLLVFDNAENPAALQPWLSDGPGHTVITSRHHNWAHIGTAVELDVFTRTESVALLTQRIPNIDATMADALAQELGDLPLGLEQAAAYLATTGLPPAEYLDRFRTRRTQMLARGLDLVYRGTIDTAWALALDQLRTAAPAAAQLLELCAQLAPEPIPLTLFREHADLLDPPLSDIVRGDDPTIDLDDTIGAALGYSLVRRSENTIQMHRLVSCVIRAHQDADLADGTATTMRALLVAHQPDQSPDDPASWPTWTTLTPHVLDAPALHPDDPTTDLGSSARGLLLDAGHALARRGDPRAARALHAMLHTRFKTALGDDHPDTIASADHLANNLRVLGNHEAARQLHQDTLTRRQRILGTDHPDTLGAASNLANDLSALGDHEAARQLHQDTLTRRQRILGDDHPNTLTSASNLANDLSEVGDREAARQLNEDTLARRQQILGSDHPDTLASANNLANDLAALGDHEAARQLDEDTLTRRRRILGDDHPDTLNSANNLALDLRTLGDHEAARQLDEDTLTRYRRTLGHDHPRTLLAASNLAVDLAALGDHEAARRLHEDTLTRRRRILGDDHPDTLNSANNLALDLRALGDHEAARQLDEDTLTRRRRILGDDHPDTLTSASNLALDLRALGDVAAAERLRAEVQARRQQE